MNEMQFLLTGETRNLFSFALITVEYSWVGGMKE